MIFEKCTVIKSKGSLDEICFAALVGGLVVCLKIQLKSQDAINHGCTG